jgi:predicted MPP superfamily phosphohydrolase
MIMNLFVFLGILCLVFVLLFSIQRFWFRALWRVTGNLRSKPLRLLIRGIFATTFLLFIFVMLERLTGVRFLQRSRTVSYVFSLTQLWLFVSFVAFLCYAAVKLFEHLWFRVKDLVTRTRPAPSVDYNRRAFFRTAARISAAIPLIAGLYGFASERFRYRVRRVEVPIADLPPALDGLQIVQLSDIHCGDYMPLDEVRRAVNMANELGAHLAVVTGDFISSERDPLAGCIAELSRLRMPLGTWGCNGNHEIYSNAEDRAQHLFRQHGMTLLRQQNCEIQFRGASFNLIGVDYQRDHMVQGPRPPMLEGIEKLVRRDIPNILLSHNPNSFPKAAELGIELSLAGHTHGGQVTVEILDKRYTPARFITPFTAGMYDLTMCSNPTASNLAGSFRRAILYVNRGLGTFALPARIGVDPEITLLRLRYA